VKKLLLIGTAVLLTATSAAHADKPIGKQWQVGTSQSIDPVTDVS
jgi:hypothetical protein